MRSWMIKLCIVGSACLFANAAYAGWQDRASQFDQQRLSRIDEPAKRCHRRAAAAIWRQLKAPCAPARCARPLAILLAIGVAAR